MPLSDEDRPQKLGLSFSEAADEICVPEGDEFFGGIIRRRFRLEELKAEGYDQEHEINLELQGSHSVADYMELIQIFERSIKYWCEGRRRSTTLREDAVKYLTAELNWEIDPADDTNALQGLPTTGMSRSLCNEAFRQSREVARLKALTILELLAEPKGSSGNLHARKLLSGSQEALFQNGVLPRRILDCAVGILVAVGVFS